MEIIDGDRAFVTWSGVGTDREDSTYYRPSVLRLEDQLRSDGALLLRDVVDFVSRPYRADGGRIVYIDISSVDSDTGRISPVEIPSHEAPSRARQLVEPGDLLVSSVRPNRGVVARVPGRLSGAVASSGFFVLRPNEQWAHSTDVLFLYLLSEVYRRQAVRRSSSSMYPVINADELGSILIPRVVLDNAREAAEALERADQALAMATDEFAAAHDRLAAALPAVQ